MSEQNTLEVKILEKEYLVACPNEEKPSLRLAASHLDQKMREIRASGKIHGTERIAVMAALNITYEMISSSEDQSEQAKVMSALEKKIDKVLKAAN